MHNPTMQEIEMGRKVTAEHKPGCDRVFTSERGAQHGCLGTLVCACGKMQPYMTPWTELDELAVWLRTQFTATGRCQ